MRRSLIIAALGGGVGLILLLASFAQVPPPAETFPTSLHYTRQGKITAYSAENGGAELITGIPMEETDCLKCHPGTYADGTPVDPAVYEPSCRDCHPQPGAPVTDEVCLKCHGRQKLEIVKLGYSDVHRDAGFACKDCHTSREMHGDGHRYASLLEPGAMDIRCERCHISLPKNPSHTIHAEKLDCTACHAQSTVTCFNCHFESLAQAKIKRHYGPVHGYMLLLNRKLADGKTKVWAGTFMAITYKGKSFYVLAPFRSHTIQRKGRDCGECHNNAAIRQYKETGKLVLTRWDPEQKKVIMPEGVIPVPPDFKEALQIDFVDYTGDLAAPTDPTKWEFLKTGADVTQLYYAEPLTEEQMRKLGGP